MNFDHELFKPKTDAGFSAPLPPDPVIEAIMVVLSLFAAIAAVGAVAVSCLWRM